MLTAFFSPTGTTRKLILDLSKHLLENMDRKGTKAELRLIDFTPLSERTGTDVTDVLTEININREEIFVLGIPVYAGRVPNILLPYLNRFKGNKTKAIIVTVYGNRHYDDALMELSQLLKANGFEVIAAGAFIGEHSFSNSLASGRPDAEDFLESKRFAQQIADKLALDACEVSKIPGNWPLRPYYRPMDDAGVYFDFKRIKPNTDDTCIHCGLCARICPMQAISHDDYRSITGICIKCCACVKQCPSGAKQFNDPNFKRHKVELEINFSTRRLPELFL